MTINIINEKEMKYRIKRCSECDIDTGNLIQYRQQYHTWVRDNDFEFNIAYYYICFACLVKSGLKL